jgi:hypothetical protein
LVKDVWRLLISWYYKNAYSDKPAMEQQEVGHGGVEVVSYFLPIDWTISSLRSMAFTVSSTCLAFMPSSNIDRQ